MALGTKGERNPMMRRRGTIRLLHGVPGCRIIDHRTTSLPRDMVLRHAMMDNHVITRLGDTPEWPRLLMYCIYIRAGLKNHNY